MTGTKELELAEGTERVNGAPKTRLETSEAVIGDEGTRGGGGRTG